MQEVITLVVFCGFSVLFLREPLKWNYFVAFGLILAAVFFVFVDRWQKPTEKAVVSSKESPPLRSDLSS